MDLLDPKQDVVFKLLFADKRNERLLISLIDSVLEPTSPIAAVTVLDPEVRKEHVDERGIVLDVLVRLVDGTRGGDSYDDLAPVVCVVFLDFSIGRRFHELYRLLEVHDLTPFSDALAIHVIELPRMVDAGPRPLSLSRWARFLRAGSASELQSLATEDPIMAEAKDALERISEDPSARAMAEARRKADVYLQLRDARSREEGREEGREEVREAMRKMIVGFAELLAVDLTEAQRRELAEADTTRLEAIATHLKEHRAWP